MMIRAKNHDWKDELVTSEQEAKAFLERHVSKIESVTNVHNEIKAKNGLRGDLFGNCEGTNIGILHINSSTLQSAIVYNFRINEHLRNHDIASMLVKSLIGMAFEKGEKQITIRNIINDGIGFWPTHGGKKQQLLPLIKPKLQYSLGKYKKDLSPKAVQRIKQIIRLSEIDKEKAWNALAITSYKINDRLYFKQSVFKQILKNKEPGQDNDLVIDLKNRRTRGLLRARLGKLPDFNF